MLKYCECMCDKLIKYLPIDLIMLPQILIFQTQNKLSFISEHDTTKTNNQGTLKSLFSHIEC